MVTPTRQRQLADQARDWRSLRLDEALLLWARRPAEGDALHLALTDAATLWRFAWPDEDGQDALALLERPIARSLTIRPTQPLAHRCHNQDPGLDLVGRRLVEGAEHSVFCCNGCGQLLIPNEADLQTLTDSLKRERLSGFVGRWCESVADRLGAGRPEVTEARTELQTNRVSCSSPGAGWESAGKSTRTSALGGLVGSDTRLGQGSPLSGGLSLFGNESGPDAR